jgi:hypothetical protein
MSLIFHRFASPDAAEAFVSAIQNEFGLVGLAVNDENDPIHAQALENPLVDNFPYHLDGAIAYIERPPNVWPANYEIERAVEDRVTAFGGEFAGT